MRVVGENLHPESLADVGEDASDLARADYARRFAVKVESCQPDKREVDLRSVCQAIAIDSSSRAAAAFARAAVSRTDSPMYMCISRHLV